MQGELRSRGRPGVVPNKNRRLPMGLERSLDEYKRAIEQLQSSLVAILASLGQRDSTSAAEFA